MAGALIVTAELGSADFAWLNGLRRAHFPPDRNVLGAHLTIFHALPPSSEGEVRDRLKAHTRQAPPQAWIDGLMDLGGGVAFRVVAPELDRIRHELASGMHGMLTAQDSGGWRPHVTIQNKVPPKVARSLREQLERNFERRPLAITGLGLHRYLDGPWEPLAIHSFSGGKR